MWTLTFPVPDINGALRNQGPKNNSSGLTGCIGKVRLQEGRSDWEGYITKGGNLKPKLPGES